MIKWLSLRHYYSILFTQIFLLFVAAVMVHHPILYILFTIALLGVFGSVITAIWESKLPRLFALITGVIAVVSAFLYALPGVTYFEIELSLFICCISFASFIFISILAITKHVFITDKVTIDRIVGSICIYLLIGMFFAFIYAAMALVLPNAFYFRERVLGSTILGLRDFLYFSLTTISTIGFGDMVPTHPIARMLACLEGIVGPIYLAIMVARLVGMHITQVRERRN